MKTSIILSGMLFSILTFFITTAPVIAAANKGHKNLSEKVETAIANYYLGDFKVTDLGNGNILIEGKVRTYYDKLQIFNIVAKVPGVKMIKNEVIIDAPTLPDEVITANIRFQIDINESIVEPNRIKVQVDNGIVFLSGEVSFKREKEIAATIASWQQGVLGVINEIKILPPKVAISDENLESIIGEVLTDQFSRENSVQASVRNGVVTLSGYCGTVWAKTEIQKRLKRVQGIKEVINNLKVVTEE